MVCILQVHVAPYMKPEVDWVPHVVQIIMYTKAWPCAVSKVCLTTHGNITLVTIALSSLKLIRVEVIPTLLSLQLRGTH